MIRGTCRICFMDDLVTRLIAPCDCRGSQLYVHRECLESWITSSGYPPRTRAFQSRYYECELCQYRFKWVLAKGFAPAMVGRVAGSIFFDWSLVKLAEQVAAWTGYGFIYTAVWYLQAAAIWIFAIMSWSWHWDKFLEYKAHWRDNLLGVVYTFVVSMAPFVVNPYTATHNPFVFDPYVILFYLYASGHAKKMCTQKLCQKQSPHDKRVFGDKRYPVFW